MGMFQADLAFTVELIAVALGFYFLHLSKKEKSKELRMGGFYLNCGRIFDGFLYRFLFNEILA
jgi:hypothetical protein